MRLPNEYWLKYLIAAQQLNNAQIRDIAALHGFTQPEDDYLKLLRDPIDSSRPKSARTGSAKHTTWLKGLRVYSMAENTLEAGDARALLDNTRSRPALETLLVTDSTVEDIAKSLGALFGIDVSIAAINLYRHYFWNRDLLTSVQWFDFLEAHPQKWLMRNCYSQGLDYALWKLGYRKELPKDEVLRSVIHEAAMRFFETSMFPNNKDTALAAKMWSESLFRAYEEADRSGDAVKEIVEELKEVSIRLGRRGIPSIEEKTNGTTD